MYRKVLKELNLFNSSFTKNQKAFCNLTDIDFLIYSTFEIMENSDINKDQLIKYWIDGAEDDFETMNVMFDSKRYIWSLFIGHLMIEKLLKAYFVKVKSDYPPLIHNLLRLAEKADLELADDKKEQLLTVTAFNINARYDDYKMSFKNLCTPEFTSEWINKLKELRLWIKILIQH
jgi:HEPN domain-containing protein